MDCYHFTCPKCGEKSWEFGSSVFPMKLDFPSCRACRHQMKDANRQLDRNSGRYKLYVDVLARALYSIGEFYDYY